jgi:hypothetical protein
MNCNECPLNEVSEKFDKDLISKAPEDLRAFFTCSEKICEERLSKHSNSYNKYLRTSICPKTVWTVIYIGCKDSFALNQVDTVFDELVEGEDDSIALHRYQYYILHGSLGFINQRNSL